MLESCALRFHFPLMYRFISAVSQLNAWYVDIGKITHVIGQDACMALPGLYAFTGCDVVSAFAGIGKVKPLKKLPMHVPATWRKLLAV